MYQEISQRLQKECQVDFARPILLGLSGGPDSLFLLDILHQIGYQLIIAHLDHQLRPESVQEANNVRKIANQLNTPIIVERLNVGNLAETDKLSIEQAARQARYEFLFRQAAAYHAQAVAVGHTADDQVETVLLHLLRGSGLSGLTGMQVRSLPNPWSQTIPLIRPILGIWREQILAYLADKPYQPNQDPSNWDTTYLRNRLRHELIPRLEGYNPRVRQNLFQMSAILDKEEQVLQKLTNQAWEKCLLSQGKDYLQFELACILAQPVAIQRRLVQKAFAALRTGLTDIEFQHIEHVLQFLENPSKSSFSQLAGGLNIFFEQNTIFISNLDAALPEKQWPQLRPSTCVNLAIPGELNLNANWFLDLCILDNTPQIHAAALSNQDPYLAWIDFDQINFPLSLRCRQPGDRFQPLGLSGKTQKLSDFMINHKMPQRARSGWPLISAQDRIVWVPGFQVAEPVKLTPKTKKVIHLKLERKTA